MANQKVMKGLALVAVAAFFGGQAATFHVGGFANAGPGLFPLVISVMLGLIGLVLLVQSRFTPVLQMQHSVRNAAVVLFSLVGFVLIAKHVNASLAIVFLVFFSTLAGSSYSWQRNLRICAALLVIAAGFRYLLGLNLPLW